MSYTFTTTSTFTRTSAAYIASKVVTDLRRMLFYYGLPSEAKIVQYYEELVELLVNGYLSNVEYGFRQDGKRVVGLVYEVRLDGSLSDGNAGGVYARADVTGAQWFSHLTYSSKWYALSNADQDRFEAQLPFRRSTGAAPEDGRGYWVTDRSYGADGVGTQRRTFRPY
jgi:hypothetical protein